MRGRCPRDWRSTDRPPATDVLSVEQDLLGLVESLALEQRRAEVKLEDRRDVHRAVPVRDLESMLECSLGRLVGAQRCQGHAEIAAGQRPEPGGAGFVAQRGGAAREHEPLPRLVLGARRPPHLGHERLDGGVTGREPGSQLLCAGHLYGGLLYPGGVSETESLLAYGYVRFASKAGQLAGNHCATIETGHDQLRPLRKKILWEGAQDIVIREL